MRLRLPVSGFALIVLSLTWLTGTMGSAAILPGTRMEVDCPT